MAGHVARVRESRNAYRVLVGRPEGKRPLGRPRGRWEDNIKMDLREVGYDDRYLINLTQDRDRWRAYVRAAMNLQVPSKPFVSTIDSEIRLRVPASYGLEDHRDNHTIPSSWLDNHLSLLRHVDMRAAAGDNAGEMSPGPSNESYPAFARIGLRENPGKNLNQITCPEPGPPGFAARRSDRYFTDGD
ncbi:hypothetical protein ANN_02700 [Periplaneta americana]|uniref:Uncharacterized protein n=1 Tax=Periplaneta americana TaxID=6978 RepID=A0ABQ8TX23_PERAM|nr:hypothetical protein ANN_02700 [Periplaneta americana]